jgi:hypothetical protein
LLLALPLSVLAGCGQQSESATNASASETNAVNESATSATTLQMGAKKTRLSFSSQDSAIQAGKPATWILKVTDAKTGAPVREFETEMTQKMHLIVVKKDLSWFNHIHPKLGQDGTLTVQTTLPSAGNYKAYADYTPVGGAQEVPQHEIVTVGATASAAVPSLTPSPMRGPWMTQNVTAHPEGEPDKPGGARYQVALMPMPAALKAGQDSMLHFQIRDASGKPLSDLQPYLGAMGHCVILSQDSNKYLHSHPMSEGGDSMAGMDHSKMDHSKMGHAAAPTSGGPNVVFHTNFPQAGLYKAWGQFKHKGQILTAAFVLNVAEGESKAESSASSSEGEHAGHSH